MEISAFNSKTCGICGNSNGKYVCPRCNVVYCSVPCYQANAHLNCSESFYKECINEELRIENRDPESQKEVYEMLQRVQNEDEDDIMDSDDDEPEEELSERLADVDLDDADAVWEKLTEEEKREFTALLQKGEISQILPPWEPWWKYKEEKKLIEEVSDASMKKVVCEEVCPKHLKNITPFDQICKKPPSPSVQYNLLNVLYAYAYMTLYFRGDHHNFALEAVNALLILSNNIRVGSNFESAEIALESAASEANNCQWLSQSTEFQKSVKNDVKCIIEGPNVRQRNHYILSALSDLHSLLETAKSETGKEISKKSYFSKKFSDQSIFSLPPVSKTKLSSYLKKIEFYLSWSKTYAADVFTL